MAFLLFTFWIFSFSQNEDISEALKKCHLKTSNSPLLGKKGSSFFGYIVQIASVWFETIRGAPALPKSAKYLSGISSANKHQMFMIEKGSFNVEDFPNTIYFTRTSKFW